MSWDVFLQYFPAEARNLTEVKDVPATTGSRASTVSALQQLFPDANISDPSWVTLERPEFVIEFNLGHKEQCEGIGLRVHGSDDVIPVILHIARHFGMRACDISTGEFLDSSTNPAAGLQGWRDLLSRATENPAPES
jgi:hypothetical protein